MKNALSCEQGVVRYCLASTGQPASFGLVAAWSVLGMLGGVDADVSLGLLLAG
jgi:hypothetical protein